MQLSSIRIQNFKSLKDVEINLSSFVCIIGENNSGKSSILLALNSFIEDSKIYERDFYDKSKPVQIEVELMDINERDLDKIGETHRDRIQEIIVDGKIILIKKFIVGVKPKILTKKLLPKDERFEKDKINEILKGKRGTAIKEAMEDYFPEYEDLFEETNTQSKAKEKIDLIIENLPPEELEEREIPLPSGIPATIKLLLPTPIFIPAVKDINDDVRTKDSSTFGKLISVLLGAIEETDEFKKLSESLDELNRLLNRIDTGEEIIDDRIEELKNIEELVNQYLKENFQKVDLQIGVPKPELKKVFSGAEICVDDGVKGLIESKGDGIKRAVTFALLRSYVEIKREHSTSNSGNFRYLILFEEPELYMHPSAQKILFEALWKLAESNQVLVTTHSPIFFSADYTGTFVKMKKERYLETKPFSKAHHVDIANKINDKDLFQMLCFENNNAAFFSEKILLVEGESDQIFFNHITKILKSNWDFDSNNIPIIPIGGKGSLKRYKEFFEVFNIDVHAILDLDVLINGFDKLSPNETAVNLYNDLIQEIDLIIENNKVDDDLSANQIKDLVRSYSWRQKWERFKELSKKVGFLTRNEQYEIEILFNKEGENQRKTVLLNYEIPSKDVLLDCLRDQNIYVLSLGTVESYYPSDVTGRDKLLKAFNACNLLSEKEKIIELCPSVEHNSSETSEFELIFQNIFN